MQTHKAIGLSLIVTLLVSSLPAGATTAAQASPATGIQLRDDLFVLIDEYQAILDRYPALQYLSEALADSRARLEQVPMSQFEEVAPQMAPRLSHLAQTTRELRKTMGAPAPGVPMSKSSGFPVAGYPNVGWEFFIPGSGDQNEADAEDATQNDICDSTRESHQALFFQQAAVLLVEAEKEIASRLCDQVVVVVGGGNASLVCIITDLLFLVARGIQDFTLLCEDLIDSAEIEGAYDRLGHLHGDLEQAEQSLTTRIATAETTLTTRIGTAETNLTAEIDVNETLIVDVDDDLELHDANLNQRADMIDDTLAEQAEFLRDFREENLRHHIEANLASVGQPVAAFQLPEVFGGHLEVVRDIVVETIGNAQAAGLGTAAADARLAKAEQSFNRGDYRKAYHFYALAYRAAAGLGER